MGESFAIGEAVDDAIDVVCGLVVEVLVDLGVHLFVRKAHLIAPFLDLSIL